MGCAAVSFGRWLPTFKRRNKVRGRSMFLQIEIHETVDQKAVIKQSLFV